MLRSSVIRAIDYVGLGQPARRLHAAGLGPWNPLVPEAAFTDCVRDALRVLRRLEPTGAFGDYLEFGVSRGTSMACVSSVLKAHAVGPVRLIGFDSFEGLPAEAAEEGWTPGQYRSTLGATRRYLAARDVDLDQTVLVKGWFKDTLTANTRARLAIAKASLIMIDCDIYTASKEALLFCEPHIVEHAIIIFDDWGWKADTGEIGQKEAFEEFLIRNPKLRAEPLPAYMPQARVFLISRLP